MARRSIRKKFPTKFIYCRKCQEQKEEKKFYDAKDKFLDTNGKMSVCIDCIGEMFEKSMNSEMSIEKAIYYVCKIMNVAYMDDVVESTKKYIDKKMNNDISYKVSHGFSWYLTYLSRKIALHPELSSTFDCSTQEKPVVNSEEELQSEDEDFRKYLIMFWGSGFTWEEYQYLEYQMARYQRAHTISSPTEESLFREVCFAELAMKKARDNGTAETSDVLWKRFSDAIKLAALDPAKQSALDSEKSMDSFGKIIKQIEETEPAEYYKNKELFKDIDNLEKYWEEYLVRPTKNFITGSRDFQVSEDGELELDEEIEELGGE